MPLRDIAVTLVVFGFLPFVLRQPYVGVLLWSWLGYMNPHRLSWGFAYNFPFAQVVVITLLISLFFSKEPKRIPITPLTSLWILYLVWMCVTTAFAIYPTSAFIQLDKVLKIQLVTFLTLMLMYNKERIIWLIWVIALSIGYFGIKGGFFTLTTGGGHRVYGPAGTFIEDNNALGLALLMILPLLNFLRMQSGHPWVRRGLVAAMILVGFSAVGTQSRGALLGGLCMVLFLWGKSRQKLALGFGIVLLIPLIFTFMPESWHERMDTIFEYRSDASAQGRLEAWEYSIKVASARVTGGGFQSWSHETFMLYAGLSTGRAAHSIYFGVLGDHGWLGLALWLIILLLVWRTGTWIIRNSRGHPELKWLDDLAKMLQVSLIAYCTGGAFLSLAYFDLPWHIMCLMVLGKVLVKKHLKTIEQEQASGMPNAMAAGAARAYKPLDREDFGK